MIELFDVTSAHHKTTSLTFEMLSTISIEKSCVEQNFVINSEKSFKEEVLRKAILDKRNCFSYFSAPGSIDYFTCDCKNIVFEDQTILLNHFKTKTRPG